MRSYGFAHLILDLNLETSTYYADMSNLMSSDGKVIMPNSIKQPAIFVSHGSPDLVLQHPPAATALQTLATRLTKPHAIIVISAHWTTNSSRITAASQLNTIHDFMGFPAQLYAMQYPAVTSQALLERIQTLFAQNKRTLQLDMQRGLDHGAWIPLMLMYPDADIPVLQISLSHNNFEDCIALGQIIAPLRLENVLILTSGSSVHNLSLLSHQQQTLNWVLEFEEWLRNAVENNHFEQLIESESFPHYFRQAHPTIEHYLPLIVAWSAANLQQAGQRIHHSFTYGNLGMSFFEFND